MDRYGKEQASQARDMEDQIDQLNDQILNANYHIANSSATIVQLRAEVEWVKRAAKEFFEGMAETTRAALPDIDLTEIQEQFFAILDNPPKVNEEPKDHGL